MKTKVVYVVISSNSDIYLEQAWVSIFSFKHYNPNSVVAIVCDIETEDRIKERKGNGIGVLLDEVISVKFDPSISNKERSRYIKTNLREYLKGDFLFIDTDTIVTDDLSEVDNFQMEIGMVYDWHCPWSKRPNYERMKDYLKGLSGKEIKSDTNYFNSGVIYAKDSERVREFFKQWHYNWNMIKEKHGVLEDQKSLTITIDNVGGVEAVSGNFNCQVIVSIEYLVTAKIIHFFNTKWSNHSISPFYDKDFYQEIKRVGFISSQSQDMILNCKSSFKSPCMIIMSEDIIIWKSRIFKLLRFIYNRYSRLYRVTELISSGLLKFLGG